MGGQEHHAVIGHVPPNGRVDAARRLVQLGLDQGVISGAKLWEFRLEFAYLDRHLDILPGR